MWRNGWPQRASDRAMSLLSRWRARLARLRDGGEPESQSSYRPYRPPQKILQDARRKQRLRLWQRLARLVGPLAGSAPPRQPPAPPPAAPAPPPPPPQQSQSLWRNAAHPRDEQSTPTAAPPPPPPAAPMAAPAPPPPQAPAATSDPASAAPPGRWQAAATGLGHALAWLGRTLWLGIVLVCVRLWRGSVWTAVNLWRGSRWLAIMLWRGGRWTAKELWRGSVRAGRASWTACKWSGRNLWRGGRWTARNLWRGSRWTAANIWHGISWLGRNLWRANLWLGRALVRLWRAIPWARIWARIRALARLCRLHRPVGTMLLLWPCLWGLFLATAPGLPPLDTLLILSGGALLMRSAGCAVNDYVDRHLDANVKRTMDRPLVRGDLPPWAALVCAAVLAVPALALLLMLDPLAQLVALVAVPLALFYPLCKRFTHLPQLWLGLAMNWGMPVAFAEAAGGLDGRLVPFYVGALCWTVAYDCFYAMADRDDDRRAGIKSIAILFGNADRTFCAMLQALALAGFWLGGEQFGLGWQFHLALGLVGALFAWQQWRIRSRSPASCLAAFANNQWVGLVLLAGIAAPALPPVWSWPL